MTFAAIKKISLENLPVDGGGSCERKIHRFGSVCLDGYSCNDNFPIVSFSLRSRLSIK